MKTPVKNTVNKKDPYDTEEAIRMRLIIDILHNMFLIKDDVYYKKYPGNAEKLDRDYNNYLETMDY
jgi:hypothetical protein